MTAFPSTKIQPAQLDNSIMMGMGLELQPRLPGCAGRPGDGSAALRMENLIPNPSPPSRIPLLGDARSEPQETNPRFPPLFRIPSYSGNGNWVVGFGDELNPGGMSCSKILKPLATNTHNKSSEAIPAECFTAKGMKYPSKFPWENPKCQTPHLGSGTTQPRSANNFISSFFFYPGH